MRICHAFLFFSIKIAGGTPDLIFKICKAQERESHLPIIYTGSYKFDKDLAQKLKKTTIRVVRSWFDKAGFSLMPNLGKYLQMDIKKIDVIHMHAFRTFQNIILLNFCKKNNIPFVLDAHGSVPYYKRKKMLKWLFDKIWGFKILDEAAFLIAETNIGAKEYLGIYPNINPKKIVVLPPPFDTEEFKSLPKKGDFRKKYGINYNKKIIMFLGRIHQIKGNDFLIESFAKLNEVRNDCILVIVGNDDGHLNACKALARKLGIYDKIIFTGFLEGNDKNSALVDAEIVAQMSRQEQGAWAPFEAVLCGTPIIVTNHTGAGEDVKKIDAGETVTFGNSNELINCIQTILNNYSQAKKRTIKAKKFIEKNMSMTCRSQDYINIYKKAIETKK